ncbi:MAG: hypothetical protein N2645_18335 [Clostridia bacterium]|nr:hypothetical protein [Clostridia bacterium]
MSPDQLPYSFEARTTMNLRGEEWDVIESCTVTSEEFVKTKELKLVLRKVDPKKNIVFIANNEQ